MTVNFIDLVENKLVFKILLIVKVDVSDVYHIQRNVSEVDLFEIFMKQYIEGFELQSEELPFTADQIKKECR